MWKTEGKIKKRSGKKEEATLWSNSQGRKGNIFRGFRGKARKGGTPGSSQRLTPSQNHRTRSGGGKGNVRNSLTVNKQRNFKGQVRGEWRKGDRSSELMGKTEEVGPLARQQNKFS